MIEAPQTLRETFVSIPENPIPEGAECIWYKSTTGVNLRACFISARGDSKPRGSAIVCPGRTEFIEKYFKTAEELVKRGFAVLILDWPGQGLSDRLLSDRNKGHIDRFDTFVDALRQGMVHVGEQLPRPHVTLAHSMGGAITLSAMMQGLVRPEAAAFCAPMWGIKQPFIGMRYVVAGMQTLGQSANFAVKPGPPETFGTNIVTHDREYWQMNHDLITKAPDLQLGPVTWGWLGAALKVMSSFTRGEALAKLTLPVFVATAAEEKLVENASHARIAERLPDCEHIEVAGARHEILMEAAERRDAFWAGFDRLLERAKI